MLPKLWRPLVLSLTSLLVVGAGPTVLAGPVDSDGPEIYRSQTLRRLIR
jgi:hypothetical protein